MLIQMFTLHQKSKYNNPNTSPPSRNSNLSSMHDKPMCESIDGDRRDIEQNPLAGDNQQWVDKEADTYADPEEEEPNGDKTKNQIRLLRSTKKQSRSTTGEKPQVRRRIKRYPFSSRLSSDEECKRGNDSDSSSYAPSELHHISTPRPISSHSTGRGGDTSNDSRMDPIDGQSQMVAIFEQQSRKGRIV